MINLNRLNRFQTIGGKEQKWVGTVISKIPYYSYIEKPEGGVIKIYGVSVPIGNKAYVVGNSIASEAVNLELMEIEL